MVSFGAIIPLVSWVVPIGLQGELCAMHLMREVDYNYHHVEHHVREFYIASSIEETTALAAEAASEISSVLFW